MRGSLDGMEVITDMILDYTPGVWIKKDKVEQCFDVS